MAIGFGKRSVNRPVGASGGGLFVSALITFRLISINGVMTNVIARTKRNSLDVVFNRMTSLYRNGFLNVFLKTESPCDTNSAAGELA